LKSGDTEATVVHSYPFCWQCDSPLLYYGRDSWFIKMASLREELLENNQQINWVPKHIKDGRFGNFLDTVVDWSLSRNRFWGTPLPIWTCPKGHFHCVGSKEELVELTGKTLPDDFELHRPWVDDIYFNCPECNEKMTREEYVIDCWYDSGSAPFAQYHYPFENKELFDEHFPFDFISEAVDQTRGWFYSLLAISTAIFKKPSYLNCVVFGHILDDKGVKMSKSKGNAISTDYAFDTEGSDAIRWYLFSTPVWNPQKFSLKTVSEVRRRAINTFWNVYSFFVNNANTDNFVPSKEPMSLEKRPKLDQWLVQAFNKLALTVKEELDAYKAHNAIKALDFFIVESLSNWYVRRSRRRFWLDMDKSYITLEDNYIESVWWSLKNLWEQKLLYKGWKIVPWCPRCGTSLSSHEVGQGYKDVEDPAITVRFKSTDMENTWFLAWTTTPWTLISNVALTVHSDYTYVVAEKDGIKYILAEELMESVLGEGWNIELRVSGQELEGKPLI